MSTSPRVLVVDDDRAVRSVLSVNLRKHGMTVSLAEDAHQALEHLRTHPCDLVLTDHKMPGPSGLELLEQVRRTWPSLPLVMMTGYGSVEDAVQAMKLGAADYLIKPVERDELLIVIDRVLEQRALRAEVSQLRQEVTERYGFENLIGTSTAMLALYQDLQAVADTSATVLIQGQTGTGKELIAHAIHYRSQRAQGAFVRINCAAIPEALLESELFGHEKGSFSGAIRQHIGKFEAADGGTILLDEIGEIHPNVQAKLLRVLENGEFQRVGGRSTHQTDVRMIASTNRDLGREVAEGRFREDLYYRLHVITLQLPPLLDREGDIPLLVEHFVEKYARAHGRPVPRVSRASLAALERYPWPGNVRQLQHHIERALILSRGADPLEIPLPHDAPVMSAREPEVGALPPRGVSLQDALAEHERRILIEALEEAGGVQAQAAKRLGLSRSNLNYRIHRLGIELKSLQFG
ncbi:MAG: sigma-54-dependent Fis family transcriptional regulator [Deltaproteobacteria bacterium]|nr:sigma-54-dependent Fis family transcriptional regulator [Deltaproteobacteria bacterium]